MEIDRTIRARLAGRTMILGVGAQKSGTSWMYGHLARRRRVMAAPLKEMHFFDAWLRPRAFARHERAMRRRAAELIAEGKTGGDAGGARLHARAAMIDDRTAYLRYFADRIGDRDFMMEMTPCYALLSEADFRAVRAYFDAAGVRVRPLLLMRDPVERLISHHRSALREGGDADDLAARVRRSIGRLPPRGDQLRRSRYDLTLKALITAFGEDAVAVGFYETMFSEPDVELRAVMRSLGLKHGAHDISVRINASPEIEPPPPALVEQAVERLAPAYRFVGARFAARKPAAWRA